MQTGEELEPEALFQGWSITLFGSCEDPINATPYTLEHDTDIKEWGSPQVAEATHLTTTLLRPSLPTQSEKSHQTDLSNHAAVMGTTSSFFEMRHFSIILLLCGILLAGIVSALCIWTRQRLRSGGQVRYHLVDVQRDYEEDG
jgi:hypothetical protein